MDTNTAPAPPRSAAIDGAAPERSSGRHRVFLGATAVVALHVVDDNFLQPAAGTSALDHLASGLVPLALLALGGWFYLRVRAGARALIAIAVGLFGVMIGAFEAGYYSVAIGPSGDDYTGLLAIPAGLVLVGLGVWVLWRSRRRTPRLWWRYSRRLLLGLVGVVALYELVLPVGVAYMSTHAARAVVPDADLGAPYENVTLTTSDGLSLQGWYVASKNGAAVISFPGRKASGTQAQTRMLVKHGYGVLLFDRRGEGASEGDGNMFGWGGERDIFAALDFLERQPDVDPSRIGGIGLSVGGELMLQAAAQDERLAAVVSEGSGTRSMPEEMEEYSAVEVALNFPLIAPQDRCGGGLLKHRRTPQADRPDPSDRAPPDHVHLGAQWRKRGVDEPHVPPARRRELVDLGDRRRQAHPRSGGSSRGVREAGRGLLRRSPAPGSALNEGREHAGGRVVSRGHCPAALRLSWGGRGCQPPMGGAGHTGHPQDPCVPLPRSCAQPHGQVNAERVCWRYATIAHQGATP